MEETAKNVDRLATIGARRGGRADRWIIVPLYECASKKLGGRPVSMVAAQRIIEEVKAGQSVLLVCDFASYPNMPFGETDGPLGVASLARAIRFGLGAIPVLVSGPRNVEAIRNTSRAAGLNIVEQDLGKKTTSAAAVVETFPILDKKDNSNMAATIIARYQPKAVISVETAGPNNKGVKHFGPGTDMEQNDRLPGLEHLFYEASNHGILTVACIDQGNEIGSGIIEEDVRRITPYGNVCRCPCKSGIACNVKTDIVFPAAISNWGAYAISAMLAFALGKPDILQDADTERRMLEACIMTGAIDGPTGRPVMLVDAVSHQANEGMISILHSIIENALIGSNIDSRFFKS